MSTPRSGEGKGLLVLRSLRERLGQSLFFVPALMLAAAVGLSELTIWVDTASSEPDDLDVLAVLDSARSLLAAIAGGVITAAAIVFSFTVLAVQLTASQFSPRTLRGFLGDRVQQVVLGVLVGTVTFCLFSLRGLRPPVGDADGFVPDLTATVAVVLAIASLLAVLAGIDHTARGLRVGSVVRGIAKETIATIEVRYPLEPDDADRPLAVGGPLLAPAVPPPELSEAPGEVLVEAATSGWVEQISDDVLAAACPSGATVRVLVTVGTYVPERLPLVAVADTTEEVNHEKVHAGIRIGPQRTMQQDVDLGLVRLGDVALRALSPSMNDPHTAEEVVVQLGGVLLILLERPAGATSRRIDDRTVDRPAESDHDAFVRAAVEEIRLHAGDEPRVLATLARTLGMLRREVDRRDLPGSTTELERQLRLVWAQADGLPAEARDAVREAVRSTGLGPGGSDGQADSNTSGRSASS